MALSSSARLLQQAIFKTVEKTVDITRLYKISFVQINFFVVYHTFQMTEIHRKMKVKYPISSKEMVDCLMNNDDKGESVNTFLSPIDFFYDL